ncbi:MAG: type II toxin-antitoxin system RelE/ParE family toxin [Coprobacillus sp.]
MKNLVGIFDIRFSKEAKCHFEQICLYLSFYNQESVIKFREDFNYSFLMIQNYPFMYPRVYSGIFEYRKLVLKRYIILYKVFVDEKCIYIVDILHQKQNHNLICKEQNNLYMIQ